MIDWNSFPDEIEQSVLSLRTLPQAPAQRVRPVAVDVRTHGQRHQGDIRFGHQVWHERQQCEVLLT